MAHTEESPDAEAGNTPDIDSTVSRSRDGFSWKMAVTAVIMAVPIALFAGWATLNLGVASYVSVLAFLAGSYFLYRKELPSEAIGSGLYVTALLMILTPLLFYIPVVLGTDGGAGAEGAGTFIGGLLGLVVWGFVFFLFAIVTAAIGYFFSKRAAKKLG